MFLLNLEAKIKGQFRETPKEMSRKIMGHTLHTVPYTKNWVFFVS